MKVRQPTCGPLMAATVLFATTASVSATSLDLTPCVTDGSPTYCQWVTGGPAQIDAGDIASAFGLSATEEASLTEKYKAEAGASGLTELGVLATAYTIDQILTGTGNDWTGATITWDGPGLFDCPLCFLSVKDGNSTPSAYLFDLGALNWDGKMTINLSGFWAGVPGEISNIAIWEGIPDDGGGGGGQEIPEPVTLALLGLGLLGMASRRYRRRA